MPGAFLNTAAPSGLSWEQVLRSERPTLDTHGLVTGSWGECMHWAVVFERNNDWESMPEYRHHPTDGPAGQVLDFLNECGHSSTSPALEKNETETNAKLDRGDQTFAFQQGFAASNAQPQAFGQPQLATPIQQGQPHHPGAPGVHTVVGVPIFQNRAQAAINGGQLPHKANTDQVSDGAKILDDNVPFPESRPCKGVLFAALFVVVVVAMLGLLLYFGSEIPKLITRVATQYESTSGRSCSLTPIVNWEETGDNAQVPGITQRTLLPNSTRRLSAPTGESPTAVATKNIVEFPGLSHYVQRVEAWADLVGVDRSRLEVPDLLKARRLGLSGRRRASESKKLPSDRDCERACSAFKECLAFDVIKASGQTSCIYQKEPAATVNTQATACWKKIETDSIDDVAAGIMGRLFGLTVAGALVSMVVALAFVKASSVQPAAATYCGVYFVPGCMIMIGLVVMIVLPNYIAVAAFVIGGFLVCCGSCLCACTWFCYRDLIPLTIEVIAAVTDVVLRYMSMLWISACSAIASVLWSFICVGVFVGVAARNTRISATTPSGASTGAGPILGYIQYFFEMLVYFWGGFVAFNTCHVTFCGVFGRWYYGKTTDSTVRDSVKVACSTSFGSICFGSLIIAVIRAMEAVARKLQNDAEESENYVACVIACIIRMVISCIGDILEWISLYAYVQVAIRGLSFISAAKATYSMATISNLTYVVSAILVGWVVSMGAVLCGLSSALASGILAYLICDVPEFCVALSVIAAIFGLLAGCIAGGSAVGVINSGAVTILMSWAENPDVLQHTHKDLHGKFTNIISNKMTESAF